MPFPKMPQQRRSRATARGPVSRPGEQEPGGQEMPALPQTPGQQPAPNAGGGNPPPGPAPGAGNGAGNAGLVTKVAAMSDEEMRQVLDIRKQQEKEKRVMVLNDLKNRVNNITVQTIWRHCKYPDLDSSDGDEFQKVLVQQMPDKTAEEVKKEWKLFKAVINLCLRGRRSYVSQMMKQNYFGKFFLLPDGGPCGLPLLTPSSCFLLPWCAADFLAYRTEGDIVYTRYDFLRFDCADDKSIDSEGNREFRKRFDKDRNLKTGERWEGQWEKFPDYDNLYQAEDLADGPALEIVAWLIHTFARSVCCATKYQLYHQMLKKQGVKFITLDDYVYIFVQAQNSIPKWTLQDQEIQKKSLPPVTEKKLTKDQKKLMKEIDDIGYEFKNGTGVSGPDGKRRYNAMMKFFYDAYFDPEAPEVVKKNQSALEKALNQLLQDEQERIKKQKDEKKKNKHVGTGDEENEDQTKKKARTVAPVDSRLAQIQTVKWACFVTAV